MITIAYRETSLSRATATWHSRFLTASRYSAAGNFVVCCEARSNEINWHFLPWQGEGRLELPIIEPFQRYEVEAVLVNPEGVLFVRGRFGGGCGGKVELGLWRFLTPFVCVSDVA